MEDFWNSTETTPAALNNFFDEECDIEWTGISKSESHSSAISLSSERKSFCADDAKITNSPPKNLTSILDNISINYDSVASDNNRNNSKLRGVRAIGGKLESWKPPSVSIKWNKSESISCQQCHSKEDEINQLKRRLERAYSRHNVTLPPVETINRMVLGQPYSLESYKLYEDKMNLLDAAINSMDTSSIVAIVNFLKNSLKKQIFNEELLKRPMAAQAYITYLKRRSENMEAIELLGIFGKTEEASLLRYQLAIQLKKPESVVKNVSNLCQNIFKHVHTHEARMIKQHLDLLELQLPIDASDCVDKSNPMLLAHPRATSLFDLPLLTTLFYCSMYHWQAGESLRKSPLYLKKHFTIPDKQFVWTVIRARARVKHWPLPTDLENLMTTKGLMSTITALSGFSGGGKLIRNSMPLERVIDTLATTGAPSHVLSAFISLLDTVEAKLRLGLKHRCHSTVIEAYVSQKDKDTLQHYLLQLNVGSPEYIKGEQAIKNMK